MSVSWIQDLLDRYNKSNVPFRPKSFEFNRPPFDPSSYYEDLRQIDRASRLDTEREIRTATKRQEPLRLFSLETSYPQSDTKFGKPLGQYNVSSGYGRRRHPIQRVEKFHTGIDLAAPEGTPIYATHSGVVQTAGNQGGYGNLVILGGANGLQTYYAHQSRMAVQAGQSVQQGQLIGYVGSTGMSTGPHLHYEVRLNGQHVNPVGYL